MAMIMKNWKFIDPILSLLIPTLIFMHLVLAPHTKVEESFNLQATHDVLAYGTPTQMIGAKLRARYDHFTFPGVVPRTFIGPVLLAGFSRPFVVLFGSQSAQLVVRLVLGMFNAACILWFKKNVQAAFGKPTARWYIVLQASQFHVIFYASRTLPNMFAFGLTTLAFANLLPVPNKPTGPRHRVALTFFVFAAVIFRSEIALLLATTFLCLLINHQTSIRQLIAPFIISFISALLISVPIDSYFWQRPIWPEFAGFWYNAIEGKSTNWGTSPALWYFTTVLPKIFTFSLLLIPIPLVRPATRRRALMLVGPSLAFVAIYSIQPHKEARFIFYVVPCLTTAAAMGANIVCTWTTTSKITSSPPVSPTSPASHISATQTSKIPVDDIHHNAPNPSPWRRSAAILTILFLAIATSFLISTLILLVSILNYPGGEALSQLGTLISKSEPPSSSSSSESSSDVFVRVHADVLACMTGISLFGIDAASDAAGGGGGRGRKILVDRTETEHLVDMMEDGKGEGEGEEDGFWGGFSWALARDYHVILESGSDWGVVAVVEGFAGVEMEFGGSENDGDDDDDDDGEVAAVVVGRGKLVRTVKRLVKDVTGGWWVGPRMQPEIYILQRRGNVWEEETSSDG